MIMIHLDPRLIQGLMKLDIHPIYKTNMGLLMYACLDQHGRDDKTDSVYNAIVEGRHGHGYSSCGDLVHWWLYRLGVRLPWVNRDELHGWKIGANISRLVFTSGLCERPSLDTQFEPGDIVVVNAFDTSTGYTHTDIVLEHSGERFISADYGQPGGALRATKLRNEHGKLWRGHRVLDAHIPMKKVIAAAKTAGLLEVPENAIDFAKRLSLPAPGTEKSSRPTLKRDKTWHEVADVRAFLGLPIGVVYDDIVVAAVLQFQKKHHLSVDGIWGGQCWHEYDVLKGS